VHWRSRDSPAFSRRLGDIFDTLDDTNLPWACLTGDSFPARLVRAATLAIPDLGSIILDIASLREEIA
jgi:hypothetical protein